MRRSPAEYRGAAKVWISLVWGIEVEVLLRKARLERGRVEEGM